MRVSRSTHGAAVAEDVERLVVLDEDAGLLEHLQGLGVDRVEIAPREDLEKAALRGGARRQRMSRWRSCQAPARAVGSDPTRFLKRSTELIGTSSASAMLNLASIAAGSSGKASSSDHETAEPELATHVAHHDRIAQVEPADAQLVRPRSPWLH